MPAREFNHLRHFCLGHLVRKDAADSHTVAMNLEHDLDSFVARLVEKPLKNVNHEFHGRIVVVQQKDFVEAGPFGFGPRLGGDADCGRAGSVLLFPVAHLQQRMRSLSCADDCAS